jgi:hypothetical protein
MFVVNNLNNYKSVRSSFKKTLLNLKIKKTMSYNFKFFESLSVSSPAYLPYTCIL